MRRGRRSALLLLAAAVALAPGPQAVARSITPPKATWLRGYWAQLAGGVAFNRPSLPAPNGTAGAHGELAKQVVFAGGLLLGTRLSLGLLAQHEVWSQDLVAGCAGLQVGVDQHLGAGFALGVELGVGKLWSATDEIDAAGAWRSWSNLRVRWAPWPRWGEWGLAVVLTGGASIDYGIDGPDGYYCNDSCLRPQLLLGVEMTSLRWGQSAPAKGQSRKTCPRSPLSTDVDSPECER